MNERVPAALAAACITCIASIASAQVAWNEAINGDLANLPGAPTPVTLNLGDNFVIGTVEGPGDVRDYITFTIAPGQALAAIRQVLYVDPLTGGPGNLGFHAINSGATSFIPDPVTIGSFLGADHLSQLPIGTDMLPLLGAAPLGGIGFTPPLGPGTYSYLVQQTGPDLTSYSFNFQVVPAPGALALLALAGLGAVRRRR